jgi:hypothetical protein
LVYVQWWTDTIVTASTAGLPVTRVLLCVEPPLAVVPLFDTTITRPSVQLPPTLMVYVSIGIADFAPCEMARS